MPKQEIKIDKGVYLNADGFEIGNSGYATLLKNAVIDEAGCNISRPGLSTFGQTGEIYSVDGLYYFSSSLISVDSNRDIYSVTSGGVATKINTSSLDGANRPVFSDDGSIMAVVGGGTPQSWAGSGNLVNMAGSPPDCNFMNYLDGYWLTHILNDQECRLAGPTAALRISWDSSDFFQAEGLPDDISAQAVLLREFYTMGARSTEIFANYGDSVTPFRRAFFIDKGIIAPYSIVQADNTLWWLDSDRRFIRMEGRTPTMISGPIDREIRDLTTVSDCWGCKIDIGGFYLIAWTFPTEQRTFVYDYRSGQWNEWKTFAGGSDTRFKMGSYVYVSDWDQHLVGDATNGNIFELSFSNHSDGSDVRRFVRQTGFIDHGTPARKRSNYYDFTVKRGVGAVGGTEPLMMIRVQDDDKPWSDEKHYSLGNIGDSDTVVRVRMRGIYRRRRLEIAVTDAVEFRLSRIMEDVEVMTS